MFHGRDSLGYLSWNVHSSRVCMYFKIWRPCVPSWNGCWRYIFGDRAFQAGMVAVGIWWWDHWVSDTHYKWKKNCIMKFQVYLTLFNNLSWMRQMAWKVEFTENLEIKTWKEIWNAKVVRAYDRSCWNFKYNYERTSTFILLLFIGFYTRISATRNKSIIFKNSSAWLQKRLLTAVFVRG